MIMVIAMVMAFLPMIVARMRLINKKKSTNSKQLDPILLIKK